jgi:hypothetical protein
MSNPLEYPGGVVGFTTQERVNIRRYCGYPQYGATPSCFQSYRFFQAYGTLEYRMSNMLPEEGNVVREVYLSTLAKLESAIPRAGENLDTDEAGPWKHNKNEVRDRSALFNKWRRDLCAFMGIPGGPGLGDGSVSFVV